MKALLNIIVLVAIVFASFFSASLYVQGNLIPAYSLVLASLTGTVLLIQSVSLTKRIAKA